MSDNRIDLLRERYWSAIDVPTFNFATPDLIPTLLFGGALSGRPSRPTESIRAGTVTLVALCPYG